MRVHDLPLGPNWTLVLFAVGVLLIYWEMCRPGMVLPGIGGLTLSVLCAVKLATGPRAELNVWLAGLVGAVLGCVSVLLTWIAIQGYLHKRAL